MVWSLGRRVLDVFLWSPFQSDSGNHTIASHVPLAHSASILVARRRLPPHLQPIIVCLSGAPVSCDGPTFLFLDSPQEDRQHVSPAGCLPLGSGLSGEGPVTPTLEEDVAEVVGLSLGSPLECRVPVTGSRLQTLA